MRAGERILSMQAELVEKNRMIGTTLDELQKLYDSLDRDLIEARKLQQTLVRDRLRDYGAGRVTLMLRPSGHVGGDLAGSFRIDERRVAVYSVDVSGHGVASAMMTARLAGLLSGSSPDQNIALRLMPERVRGAWPPAEVAARLNRVMLEELQVDQYFTMVYAEIDLTSGEGQLVQAGHPHPAILSPGGVVRRLGAGGLPVGLIPDASYETETFRLVSGDRLALVSDGVTECPDAFGVELGAEGFHQLLARNAALDSPALLEALVWDLATYRGSEDFPDDISGLVFEWRGAG
jgi:sigma-B regulation protein RsbU (phosphoserine phosphatase)